MLPTLWVVVVVVAAVLASMWVTFTVTRLDRLHARVDAARAALDAQLVRRAAALLQLAEATQNAVPPDVRATAESAAQAALTASGRPDGRESVENTVGREMFRVAEAVGPDSAELREAAARVQVARRFYNDAVRDTRTLRARRMPRLLRLAGRVAVPQFFDIDDSLPAVPAAGAPVQDPSQPNPPAKDSA